ncbi:MAG TPA: SoxR reducing system RseC family protein [Spirochaetota bacterium]|nr:SoxR reducing system RseC family protein [Spirochaetota bacterium]HOS32673.1 SoxR reducing system RseC family protein [Spirochaetota bacterium]HOS56342.1 SoxR reducing system RseC family protein [Spirochaetota bacterium]HPK62435.1 SoxR reducing system RseC family protein [Spirochaetota bacterium]HQF78301.1 SoxR reducing system RseC family protein [Spirochaetota bacterium]
MEYGIVKEIISSNRLIVDVVSKNECSSCSAKEGCRIFDKKCESLLEAGYSGEIKEGDKVLVNIKPAQKIFSSVVIFLLPLVFMFLFYFLAGIFVKIEIIEVLSAITGLIASFIMITLIFKSKRIKNLLIPIVEIIENPTE